MSKALCRNQESSHYKYQAQTQTLQRDSQLFSCRLFFLNIAFLFLQTVRRRDCYPLKTEEKKNSATHASKPSNFKTKIGALLLLTSLIAVFRASRSDQSSTWSCNKSSWGAKDISGYHHINTGVNTRRLYRCMGGQSKEPAKAILTWQ